LVVKNGTRLNGATSLVTKTPDYNGEGDTLYVVNGSTSPYYGAGAELTIGGMKPGIYTYYTYVGFTDTDPDPDTDLCVLSGGELITDTSGIIAPEGEPRVLCRATKTIVLTDPNPALLVNKAVADVTRGEAFHPYPHVSNAFAGDTIKFRVQIVDIGSSTLRNAVVYDVLPHIGDTGTINGQTDVQRGTTDNVILTAVAPPAGWTVSYTTSDNPCRPELGVTSGCENVTWTTPTTAGWATLAPEVLQSIGAIRLTKASMTKAELDELYLTYEVPPASEWTLGNVVWNSVGAFAQSVLASDGSLFNLPPTEAPKVGFTYPSAEISWQKTDQDGVLLPGATFRLTGPKGFSVDVTDNGANDVDPAAGKITVGESLDVGEHTITEIAAPTGYRVTTDSLTLSVTQGEIAEAGTIVNWPSVEITVFDLPAAGGSVNVVRIAAAFVILGLGAVFVIARRRFTA
jgi:hypothetical protein